MNNRERVVAVLNYQEYDRLPLAHFGFWTETLKKWADEGHIPQEDAKGWGDGNPADVRITRALGFDLNYYSAFHPGTFLSPPFERKVMKERPDGSKEVLNHCGVIELEKPGAGSIPAEIEHLFKDRTSWEETFKHRLQFNQDRVNKGQVLVNEKMVRWDQGGKDFLEKDDRDYHYGLHCGSLMGNIRNMVGMENLVYLYAMDEELYTEVVDTVAELCYQVTKATLEQCDNFDFAHFWEDICFKNGPLVHPQVFAEKVGHHYRRIADLCGSHGINIVSLDCDGCIDQLLPVWLEHGVNTMFPIEVGTWHASIAPWREQYGKELRGVGGMNKTLFAHDFAAIDREVERLKPLVDLGGYLPCPDHRIAPDAKWENVRYYCDKMREAFGG